MTASWKSTNSPTLSMSHPASSNCREMHSSLGRPEQRPVTAWPSATAPKGEGASGEAREALSQVGRPGKVQCIASCSRGHTTRRACPNRIRQFWRIARKMYQSRRTAGACRLVQNLQCIAVVRQKWHEGGRCRSPRCTAAHAMHLRRMGQRHTSVCTNGSKRL
jgi:hypothetical protein